LNNRITRWGTQRIPSERKRNFTGEYAEGGFERAEGRQKDGAKGIGTGGKENAN
jgi:hypothetical protein